jgi:hypothetical protein
VLQTECHVCCMFDPVRTRERKLISVERIDILVLQKRVLSSADKLIIHLLQAGPDA